MRRMGTCAKRSAISASLRMWIMAVSIGPGCTEFTRMPRGARSTAADLVMPRSAHFVAL
jgi:hypothetical protein